MALVLKDRVKETTTTVGTGSFALAGAVTGYDSFGQIGNGNTTYYAVYLDGGSEWEVGIGTYTAPSTLSRDTILASSNSGSAVSFSAGQKTIWCDYPAGKAVYLDAAGSISEPIVNISGISGAISTVDTIGFDTTYATTLTAGQLGWNGNDTLGLGMIGGNVIQHIGEDQYFYCKATANITKGQVVMFTGAVGASGVPTGAPATGITDGSYIMGIAAEAIANNGFGLVQSFGTLRNVNTSGYADGDILWYDPTVTGGLTKTKPSAPNVKVQMAAVINGGSAGGGTILIRINAGSTLGGTDSNAQFNNPQNGQIITYDGVDGYWKNSDLNAGTAISVSETSAGVLTIANTGVTQATAGTGISVSAGTGNVTITNTAPDQTVAISAGTGISVTGTYPNFTVANTGVTSVSGTSPIVSSGGTTPAISIPAANGSTNGYLTSTDWTTFNNKANAFTYTSTYIPYGQGTTTPNQSANLTFDGTTQTAPIQRASNGIVVNSQTVSANYTIASGDSGMSAGPVTVASGVTVTVSSGSRWVVL
jgi:hypothetical protein